MRALRTVFRPVVALTLLSSLGCALDISEPTEPEIQVIEELDFAPSLGIDLITMLKTPDGVYYKDIQVGEGDPLAPGDQARVKYTGWLYDGTRFDAGEVGFLLGGNQVIRGFEQGVEGMRLGGVRLIIVPPLLAYGIQGAGNVPPGAVVIFQVEILEIAT